MLILSSHAFYLVVGDDKKLEVYNTATSDLESVAARVVNGEKAYRVSAAEDGSLGLEPFELDAADEEPVMVVERHKVRLSGREVGAVDLTRKLAVPEKPPRKVVDLSERRDKE